LVIRFPEPGVGVGVGRGVGLGARGADVSGAAGPPFVGSVAAGAPVSAPSVGVPAAGTADTATGAGALADSCAPPRQVATAVTASATTTAIAASVSLTMKGRSRATSSLKTLLVKSTTARRDWSAGASAAVVSSGCRVE